MESVVNIYKPVGITPLQAIDAIRKIYPEYQGEKMTYAGRLDPMAEGVLLVLVGNARYKKDEFLTLDKTYEAEILLGIGTDTHDILGMPKIYSQSEVTTTRIRDEVQKIKGDFVYQFPVYASKPINGKPLFQWAREGGLEEIKIPTRLMRVHEVELQGQYTMTARACREHIVKNIGLVRGDFRQQAISEQWRNALCDASVDTYVVVRVRIRCASGTYIRTIAHELGKRLGTDAILIRLIRTEVGSYRSEQSREIDKL